MGRGLRLEELEVYKVAMEIGEIVWNIISKWDYFEKKTLGAQFANAPIQLRSISVRGMDAFTTKRIKIFATIAGVLRRRLSQPPARPKTGISYLQRITITYRRNSMPISG